VLLEGILVLFLGLASGLILGYILTKLMRPYISMAVARDLPGMIVHQININWQSVSVVIVLLAIWYALATALIIISFRKTDIQQELRTGVE
jgi:hypothetical protein